MSLRRRRAVLTVVAVCFAAFLAVCFAVAAAPAAPAGFTDVSVSHPYFAAVADLSSREIIQGYAVGDGWEFRPDHTVFRAQFAKMICGVMGLVVVEDDWPDATVPFTDLGSDVVSGSEVANTLYPHEYVAVAYLNGITNGQTPTTFAPYTGIKRVQVVTMIVRAAQELVPGALTAPSGFAGAFPGLGAPHEENLRTAEYNGLLAGVLGFGSGWDLWAEATRGETAQMLHNLLAKLGGGPSTTTTTSTTSSTTTTTAPNAGWENLGGALFPGSSPAVCSRTGGVLDVFVWGADLALWHKSFKDDTWSEWESLGGICASSPTAAYAVGMLDVYVLGIDGHLWRKHSTSKDTWSDWIDLGGTFTSGPAACPYSNMEVSIFVRGSDGALWYRRAHGDSLTGWSSLHGSPDSDPAAVNRGLWADSLDLEVFVRGPDDALWQRTYGPPTWQWSDWQRLGGILTSGPGVASWGQDRLDVFVRGVGDTLWRTVWKGSGWSAWESLGGAAFVSDPDAISWSYNRIDVFVQGTDNALWHRWWDGYTWKP